MNKLILAAAGTMATSATQIYNPLFLQAQPAEFAE